MALNVQFIANMKAKLEDEQMHLEKQLQSIAKKNKGEDKDDFSTRFPSYGDKEDDNAAEVAQYTDNLSMGEALGPILDDVKHALTRIQEGTYGTCRHCGNMIDERRLSVRPSSSSCVACKQKLKAIGVGT